jgi:predicted nucleic acid-binding protein
VRFALDSNVLVYALIRDDEFKHAVASRILLAAAELDAVVPAQVLGEYLNVIRRKHPEHFKTAVEQAARWQITLSLLPTTDDHVVTGALFAARHQLQLWDAIIWQVARSARPKLFLTEDLQDHFSADGMKALNPFNSRNERELNALLSSADDRTQG